MAPEILTYGYGVIELEVEMVIFWQSRSFHYYGSWIKREVQSFSIFVILSTFTANKHKYLKKQKQMKSCSSGKVTSIHVLIYGNTCEYIITLMLRDLEKI